MNSIYIPLILSYQKTYIAEKQFEQKKASIHILIAGDSHPLWAVYPPLMDGSFVIATPDEHYMFTYYRLYSIINKENMDIQLVLLPIDLHTFSSYREKRLLHNDYWRQYINYWELGIYKGDLLSIMLARLGGEFSYINGVEQLIDLLMIKTGKKVAWIITDGHKTVYDDFSLNPDALDAAKYRVKKQIRNKDILDEYIVHYFLRTIDLLSSHDIDVVLVKYPITQEYYHFAGLHMDIDEYYENISQLVHDNGYNFPLLDYHDLFWDKPHYYGDEAHLNIFGAKDFTPILRDDLIQLGVYPDN